MAEGKTITIIQKGKTIPQHVVNLKLTLVVNCDGCDSNNPNNTYWWVAIECTNPIEEIANMKAYIQVNFKWEFQSCYHGGTTPFEFPLGVTLGQHLDEITTRQVSIMGNYGTCQNVAGDYGCQMATNFTADVTLEGNNATLGTVQKIYSQGECQHLIEYPGLIADQGDI